MRRTLCDGYRCGKWDQQHESKYWTGLFVCYFAQIPLWKKCIYPFSSPTTANYSGKIGSFAMVKQPV